MKTSSLDSPKPRAPLKILIMGPPGAGKTTLALQFPEVHVFDCDQNLDGPEAFLKDSKRFSTYTYDTIRYDDNNNAVDIEQCYNRLCDKLKLFKVEPAYKARKTIIVDSLSHVNEFIIRHTLALQGKTRKNYEMEARDWNPFKSFAYILIMSRLEESAKTVICTAHEVKITEPDDKNLMQPRITAYEPFFQGKLGDMLGGYFTDFWRMEKRAGPAGTQQIILQAGSIPKCDQLKNSIGLPAELDVTKGFSVIEPFLRGKL